MYGEGKGSMACLWFLYTIPAALAIHCEHKLGHLCQADLRIIMILYRRYPEDYIKNSQGFCKHQVIYRREKTLTVNMGLGKLNNRELHHQNIL